MAALQSLQELISSDPTGWSWQTSSLWQEIHRHMQLNADSKTSPHQSESAFRPGCQLDMHCASTQQSAANRASLQTHLRRSRRQVCPGCSCGSLTRLQAALLSGWHSSRSDPLCTTLAAQTQQSWCSARCEPLNAPLHLIG